MKIKDNTIPNIFAVAMQKSLRMDNSKHQSDSVPNVTMFQGSLQAKLNATKLDN